jgi:hypothetical protein
MVPQTSSSSRAQVKWPVAIDTTAGSVDGVIVNINRTGAFIRCHKPLRLKETCRLTIESPDHPILDVDAEVVWTNIYGPDDRLTPRGMGVLFTGGTEDYLMFLRDLVSEQIKAHQAPEEDQHKVAETMH